MGDLGWWGHGLGVWGWWESWGRGLGLLGCHKVGFLGLVWVIGRDLGLVGYHRVRVWGVRVGSMGIGGSHRLVIRAGALGIVGS